MLNRYPLWKNCLIILVVLFGALYASPNFFPEDYAVQVSGTRDVYQVDQSTLDRVTAALKRENVNFKSAEVAEGSALIRVANSEDQLKAKAITASVVGENYVVALNLAATTPEWLTSIGAGPMKLGLDLRGGVHFLLEVDMVQAVSQRLDVYVSEIKTKLRSEKLRYRSVEHKADGSLSIKFADAESRDEAQNLLRRDYVEFLTTTEEADGAYFVNVTLTEQTVKDIEDYAIKQNLTILRNRVNELGVAEPLVQRQGRNRIVVQLPGVQDAAAAKRIIGKTANLEFRLEATPNTNRALTDTYEFRSEPGRRATLEKDIIISGASVANAQASFDENGQPQVSITLDSKGGQLMNRTTRDAVQRRMAVIFVENKARIINETVDGQQVEKRIPYVEKKIISLATIQSVLGNQFRITGLDGAGESSELALLLRAGALAAPIYFVEERTVGPSLGAENIKQGVISVEIGFALVLVFMLAVYRMFGFLANIALCTNLLLLVAVMSILSATLTLPGIAGIVLTVGMAVDANVLIFARIKEELKNGIPPQSAINAGFERAFTTIFDANITTLLAAVILFAMGTGPVKGFAITLSVGIITSMFTAIVVTRALVNLVYGGRQIKKLSI
ncbi:protein translocase subunit SecD [Neptunomonas phycophila]|jgi:preprotein translocase subunit SecD|uniref:Protein translocase subunit SecD n=2 Tax=Neptunomonas phycophila TaxID=1572645 RepID=A0AAW7XQ42_9GAMM|nr:MULTISPECIES: protein translocase subunit SecD [Neptunomonas]MBT3144793.1 protein translocase subunit SecD [Neptunomonas phycophila]MDN2658284.1 protein translocase subunit SecD [Neptunomonas sp. CHC150]MDO6455139.1 protein translocase subunit SecD [Neptunomonas phycophila]MDO6468637.1 protein translocase subunit SecD [Neptunomonas phycophila]MDO6785921.1 protein translocase subunit SecD [Neptunomonas phycophila]